MWLKVQVGLLRSRRPYFVHGSNLVHCCDTRTCAQQRLHQLFPVLFAPHVADCKTYTRYPRLSPTALAVLETARKPHTVHAAACGSTCGGAMGASETKPDQYICLSFKSFQATRHSGSHCSCCQTARHISSPVSGICIAVLNPCNRNCSDRRAHGVVVSHPLRMRKALGSIPSVSNLLPSLR